MPSTAIGLSFDLHDLSANYEVVGTSDNYSFQYQLGKGKDLVTGEHEEYDLIAFGQNEFTGEKIQTIVPLKGNYGDFNIRVFAVSDIGTRSEFVQEQIYISPPTFDGTFTFANLKIDDLPDGANLNNLIIDSPDNVGDTLEVESEYVNKNISLSWDLIPPEGHSLGGQAVNEELNSDAFFDHFEIKIKNTKDNILIDDATLNNSVSLQDSLSTANVAGKLSSYKSFNLQISEAAFSDQELNLDRHVFFEISAFDSKGGSCTGTLSGINFLPDLSLSQRTSSSDSSFFFSSEDSDFKSVEVNYIGIPANESLNDIYNLQNNIDFFKNIKDARQYVSLKDEQFYQDQSMVVFEGDVYVAQQDHLNSNSTSPPNSSYWLNIGPKVEYVSESLRITEESFVNKQIFGYSYYYTFRPSDGYGTGQLFNFTEDGLVEASNFAELSPITSEIKIENLNFREREDDLIFEWNFVDQDGLPVELANEKYQINFGDEPKVLGLSGHLFDNHTNRYLSGIGEEKLNSEFTYSRELNNSIYKDGGFPEGVENFNSSEIYTPDDNDKVIDKTDIFDQSQYFTDGASEFFSTLPVEKEFVYNSIKQNAAKQPYVRPFYEYWDPAKTYYYRSSLPFSDVVKYNGVLYESLSDSGPESSEEIGVFNENTVYNLNDLVVAPSRMIEIFNSTKSYLSTDVVLYEGAIYEALTNQSVGNAVEPDLDSSFWKIIRPFYDIDCFIYKYVASSSASTLAPTRDDTQSWQLQTPDVSDKFKICIDSYSNTPNADYVFFNETVYKANISPTTSEPPIPLTTLNQDYTALDWTPFWEINDSLEDVVFGHVGIPESGKRSVGLEVGIVSSDGQVVSKNQIIGDNPAPVISSNGFSVDSESEVTKVKFNFNYLLGRQEKTTLLNLYRSDQPDFGITGSDGLPFTEINQTDSTLVKSVVGEGDATFGDNITQIVDDTAEVGEEIVGYYYKLLPFDDFGSGALYTAVNDEDPIEKVWVLPKNFHSKNPDAPTGPAIKITTDEIPGPVKNLEGETAFENYFLNWNMPNAQIQNNLLVDAAPNDISYYEVWQSAGQPNNFLQFSDGSFLTEEQNATGYRRIDGIQYTFGDNIPTEYEDFANGIVNATNVLDIDASSPSIQITHRGQVNDTSYFWVRPVDHAGNKGPFTGASDLTNTDNVEGLKLILGQAKTTDIADFEQNISQSFPNTISLIPQNPFSYDASTNTTSWINHILYYDGVGYIVEAGTAVDQKYIYWSSSRDGVKYGDVNDSNNLEYSRNQALKTALGLEEPGGGAQTNSDNLRNVQKAGVYNSSDYHPAGAGDSTEVNSSDPNAPYNNNEKPNLLEPEGDFIIARIAGGTVTTMWHSFANATIGTAHIEEAAITSAKIHTLTADKIRSAEIKGQDIQVGGTGQIRSFNFPGLVNPIEDQPSGFAISGDGTFIFAGDEGRLHFDDGELVLEGKLRTKKGKEYTFIDLDASPDSFFYNELSDGSFTPDDNTDVCNIRATFQNSFIESNEVRFKIESPDGTEFVSYDDVDPSDGSYNENGFTYNPSNPLNKFDGIEEPRVANAQLTVGGFNSMINTVDPQLTTIIVSVSGVNTSTERSIPINFVADGAAAVYVELTADQQVFEYDSDGENGDPTTDPTLTATDFNTHGKIYYNFKDSAGLSLQNSESNSYVVPNIPEEFKDMPITFSVDISGENDSAILASDRFTFFGTHPGKDSYTVFLTNENHTYPANEVGDISSVDLAGGKTQVRFFKGNQEYAFDETSPFGENTFSLVGVTSSDSDITHSEDPQGAGVDRELFIKIDQYPDDKNEGTFTIKVKDNQYSDVTFEKIYTYSKAIKGVQGNRGVGITFRGVYDPTEEEYIGAVDGGNRGDVVEYNGSYYLCIQDNGTKTGLSEKNPTDGAYWEGFGAEFSSVATDILLAKDAAITHSLVMGTATSINGGAHNPKVGTSTNNGSGGIIRSANKTGFGDGNKGFFLGDTDVVEFEVGDSDSFIKFDTDSDRVEIKGSLIINSRDYTDLDINSIDNKGDDATFIGGGYNNFITGSQAGQDGLASSIVGGGENDVSGRFSFIGGGFDNNLGDNFSAIVAGYNNEMPNLETGNAGANFIGAGVLNVIDGGSSQSVCNGKFNEIIYSTELYLGEIVPEDQTNVVFNDNMDLLGEKYFAFDPKDGVYPIEDFIIGDASLSSAVPSVKLITLAYRSLLYREPDSTGINNYLGFSDMGSVISNIKTAPEYSTRQNNLPAPKLQMILADSSKGLTDPLCIIGSRIAEKFHVPRDFLSGTRNITLGNWGILENPFYTKDPDLSCFFVSNSRYYDSSSEFGYWVYALGTDIDGWVYISASYSSEGIWVYNTSYGWIFIFNSETFNLSYGAYQRFDNGTNYKLSDGSVIP